MLPNRATLLLRQSHYRPWDGYGYLTHALGLLFLFIEGYFYIELLFVWPGLLKMLRMAIAAAITITVFTLLLLLLLLLPIPTPAYHGDINRNTCQSR